MGNLGGGEILVILLVALIVLGPTKLPAAVRQAGRFMGEIRRIGQGFQQELREAAKPLAEATETIKAASPRNVIAPPPADKNKGAAASGKGSTASGPAASGPASWGTAAASAGAPLAAKNQDENQDAATSPTVENQDAGTAPTVENQDAATAPTVENQDAGTPPTVENQDAGTPPTVENQEADAPATANGEDAGAAADGTPSADAPDAGGPEAAEQDPESRTTGTA